MDLLNNKLYKLFLAYLLGLNIGYDHDNIQLQKMVDIVQVIDYIQHGDPTRAEIQKLINIYAQ